MSAGSRQTSRSARRTAARWRLRFSGPAAAVLAGLLLLLLMAIPIENPDLVPSPSLTTLERVVAVQQRIGVQHLRWRAGVTGISHLTPQEFDALLGARPPELHEWQAGGGEAASGAASAADPAPRVMPVALGEEDGSQFLPSRWDWRELGGVTAARHQGACGGCWAFAAAGAVEGLARIYDEREIDLSEQQVLDCNTAGYGCDGGWMTAAYRVWHDDGAFEESVIPYRAQDGGPCPTALGTPAARVAAWTAVVTTRSAIKHALLRGPIAVGMHVYPDFQHYQEGVYEHEGSDEINHAVVLVGWDDDLGAWILKNSWGQSWGQNGFAYVAYDCCRLGSYPHRVQIEAARALRIHHAPQADPRVEDQPVELEAVVAALSAPLDIAACRVVFDRGDGFESLPLDGLTADDVTGVLRATLPALSAGTRVRYYLEAADARGAVAWLPEEGPAAPYEFHVLRPVYSTAFEEAGDWIAGSGEDGGDGQWELAAPGAVIAPGDLVVQPDADHSADGTLCWVTGAAGGAPGDHDVDGGPVWLTGPIWKLSGYEKAVVEVWLWFMNQLGPRAFEDPFVVQASADGGATWTTALETRDGRSQWQLLSIPLHEHVTLTDEVRVRFLAADTYDDSVVEAAIDDLVLLAPAPPDAGGTPGGSDLATGWDLSIGANPSRASSELVLTLVAAQHVRAELFDASGRRVQTLWNGELAAGTHRIAWNGRDADGRPAGAGRYWARVAVGSAQATRPLLLLP